MKYNEDYLKKDALNEQAGIAALGGLGAALSSAGIGAGVDTLASLLRPPLDLAKQMGRAGRADQYKRISKAGFAGVAQGSNTRDMAIRNILTADYPNLLSRLKQRAGEPIRAAGQAAQIGIGMRLFR